MDHTDRQALAQALAETYTYRSAPDTWTIVQQYRRVREYAAAHPDAGSHAVASALDVPRSRIRPWVDSDSRPDPVRAIETADEAGWLDCGWHSETFAALNVLVAWTFSGGTINDTFVPAWTIDSPATRDDLATALDSIGVAPTLRNERADGRATEVLPARDASVLGRVLAVLGAPVGGKSVASSPPLPTYLSAADCPYYVQLDFARVVVRNRGVARPDRPRRPVQLREERSTAYHEALRDFLGDVVGERASITGDSEQTYLTERAAAVLCPPPTFGDWLPPRE